MGNKLFLRELRRSTIDRELAIAILADYQNYYSDARAARYYIFFPFPLFPRTRFVRRRSCRDWVHKVIFISPLKYLEIVPPSSKMPYGCRGSYALVVLNPHHVTLLVRTWRPSSIAFPSEAQSMTTFSPFCNTSFHFQISCFLFSADFALQN